MPDAPADELTRSLTASAGPCPCDGCRSRQRCAERRMACDAYAGFLAGFDELRWMRAPRVASTARYASLFGDPDLTTRRPAVSGTGRRA